MVTTTRALLPLSGPPPGAAAKHEREARTKHLLEKCLENGRKRSQPQRINDQQMIRLANGVLRRQQHIGRRTSLEILLCAKPAKVQRRNVYTIHDVASRQRPVGISVSQRVAKVTAGGIRVPLDDGNPRQTASSREPGRHRQILGTEKLRIEQLRLIP